MFTSDAARIIGIKPKELRMFLRNRNVGVGSGSRYEFSYDEVEALKDEYWAAQPRRQATLLPKLVDTDGTPGLPIAWLPDPEKQPLFLAERKARLERLSTRLREVGLDVPQMSEQTLKINNRAIEFKKLITGEESFA